MVYSSEQQINSTGKDVQAIHNIRRDATVQLVNILQIALYNKSVLLASTSSTISSSSSL